MAASTASTASNCVLSVGLLNSLFGITPKVKNGKIAIRIGENKYKEFEAAWKAKGLPNNHKTGFFHYPELCILQAWG